MPKSKYKLIFFACCFCWCIQTSVTWFSDEYHRTKAIDILSEKMFAGISLEDELGLVKSALNALNWAFNGGDLSLGDTIQHIPPKHLALLLQFNGEFASKSINITNQTYLKRCTKFFVSFADDENDKEIDYHTMEILFKSISEYNMKHNALNTFDASKKVEIWISIPATKNFENVMPDVLERIRNVNSISPNTVTALLLNYRSLHVTVDSVHQISEDISSTKRATKKLDGANLKTGMVVEMHNCQTFLEFFPRYNFHLNEQDEIMFVSQLHGIEKEIGFDGPSLSCFFYKKLIQAKISIQVPVKTIISLESSTYEYKVLESDTLQLYELVSVYPSKVTFIVKTEVKELSKNQNFETYKINENIDTVWLGQNAVFAKTNFGVSVRSSFNEKHFPSVIPLTFKNFRKIIVDGGEDSKELKSFASSLAHYQMSQVKHEMSKGQVKSYDIPAQLLILANINTVHSVTPSVKEAFAAALFSNQEYPGIASIILSVDDCFGDVEHVNNGGSVFLKNQYLKPQFLSRFWSLIKAIGVYEMERLNKSILSKHIPNVGVMSEFCAELVAFSNLPTMHAAKTNDIQSDLLLLKLKIHFSDVMEYGATKTASSIIRVSRNCDIMMTFFKPSQRFNLYVQMTGCNKQADIYKHIEVVKFWEYLNKWSVKEDKIVFMDTGFEYPENVTRYQEATSCRSNLASCGWWKGQHYTGGNASNGYNWTWQDTKSIAFGMYEKLNNDTKEKRYNERKVDDDGIKRKILMGLSIPTAIFIIGIIAVSSFLVFRYRSRYILSQNEIERFWMGHLNISSEQREAATDVDVTNGASSDRPYDKDTYDISRSAFQMDLTRRLGSGEFATVVHGTIKRGDKQIQVAVKMTKKRPSDGTSHGHYLAVKGLISEIKILSYVGDHQHIVKLEGACTAVLKSGKLFVFLELCERGSLNEYLRACKPSFVEGQEGMEMVNLSLSQEMSEDLRRWANQIVDGMEYLSSLKVVHADLATRNILLTSSKCVKISDFGLSRRLYDYAEYLREEECPLPWRWMAPESLTRKIFNEKTDVWSFGVTLWEMYTLGDEPYPGLTWNANFPSFLERGGRLCEPRHNPDNIYSVMRCCWEGPPGCRPTFAELRTKLQDNGYAVVL